MSNVIRLDTNTGEIADTGMLVYIPQRPKLNESWLMMFQEALQHLATNKHLTLTDRRVLDMLMAKLDFENYIRVTQDEIAKTIGIDKAHVSRSFKKLTDQGCILPGPKTGKVRTYRLSPNLGWKGRIKNLQEERRNRLKIAISNNRDEAADPDSAA